MADTDYRLLGIIAVVASLAIIGMAFLSLSATGASTFSIARASLEPTGNFAAEADEMVRVPREIAFDQTPDYDLDSDGMVDDRDLSALIRALDSRCPPQKTCDVTADGVFDVRDTAALAALVLERDTSEREPAVTVTKQKSSAPSALA